MRATCPLAAREPVPHLLEQYSSSNASTPRLELESMVDGIQLPFGRVLVVHKNTQGTTASTWVVRGPARAWASRD
eukprot:31846-Prorocentrum_minimum.AAC.7